MSVPLKKRLYKGHDSSSVDDGGDAFGKSHMSETRTEIMRYEKDELRKSAKISGSSNTSDWGSDFQNYENDSESEDVWDTQDSVNDNPVQSSMISRSYQPLQDLTDDTDPNSIKLPDVHRVIVTRDKLETWLGTPFWKSAIKGIYVRIGASSNTESREYKIAEIVGDKKSSIKYSLPSGKECKTDLLLRMVNPKLKMEQRSCPVKFVSNSSISQAEFLKWCSTLKDASVTLPTKEKLKRLEKQISDADNYRWTLDDVKASIEKEQSKGKVLNITKERIYLEQQLQYAHTEDQKQDLLQRLDNLNELQEERKKNEEIDGQAQKLAKIHQRNKELNKEREKSKRSERRKNPSERSFTGSGNMWRSKRKREDVQKKKTDLEENPVKKKAKISLAPSERNHHFELDIDFSLLDESNKEEPKPPSKNLIKSFRPQKPFKRVIGVEDYINNSSFY